MGHDKINNFLIPNVLKIPSGDKAHKKVGTGPSEFESLLKEKIDTVKDGQGVKISIHAAKRISERSMEMNPKELQKIHHGIEKLKIKGGQDSLLITGQGAYIVDVPNKTIVTAMDKGALADNVFTKIDSTIILD